MHEQLDRMEEAKGSSERSFGLTFAAVGVIAALWPLLHGGPPRVWLLAVAVGLVVISLFAAWTLRPLNRLWSRLGLLLNRVVSPIVLGVIFYAVVTPVGFVLRARGRDLLRLRFDQTAPSYWIVREPPGPRPNTMNRQF
jgi:predicted membrane metal-binding protein